MKPLLTMGANEDGFPLAAIYRTRHGRRLNNELENALGGDTDPPISEPEILTEDLVELRDLTGPIPSTTLEIERDDILEGALELLRDVIPSALDPALISDVVLGFAESVESPDDSRAWYRRIYNRDFFRTRPVRLGRKVEIETNFIRECLNLPEGSRVLDVGCGYAPIGNSLARDGYQLVGVDLNQDMLDMAAGVAKSLKTSGDFILGDMRQLSYLSEFDGVICLDSTFGYFSDAENLVTLRAMARALKPGGRLVIDVANRDRIVSELPARSWWEGDGCLIQEDAEFNPRTSRLRIKRLLVLSDGRQDENYVTMRLFSAHELVSMLRLVGLDVVEVSGSVHSRGAFFCGESERLYVVAQAPL